ncbi:hypothetical protein EV11_1692 [Prochlorococcus sp. SS52]|nr:hypothetical protein EV04_0893 [Prochlorococcus marinus str. LG]KGG21825.1 hypothetical protein EV08_0430 [Prochlorococcus marinus str. SS2]KGG23744.1 hypothetical protein EV09_1369 [Prochlorococcus marinus str. SS35]KGG32020.1 hypothetical protein EV10_1134 [Prochlorococcus marinus str. SS51]KGG35289.1 hypothetical protein EV11_1692 [Prochlorococcus sp. SS52]
MIYPSLMLMGISPLLLDNLLLISKKVEKPMKLIDRILGGIET